MMASGEIQAGFTGPAGVGRSGPPITNWDMNAPTGGDAGVYPELIANVEQVEADWYRRTGILPIHGLIVVKDEHLKRHPWLARALMDAFVAAKKPYLEELKLGKDDTAEDKRYRKFLSLMSDPLPYGISANRASIEALVTYALQQELIPVATAARRGLRPNRSLKPSRQQSEEHACQTVIDIHPHIVSPDTKRYPLAPLGGTQSTWSSERPTTYQTALAGHGRGGCCQSRDRAFLDGLRL